MKIHVILLIAALLLSPQVMARNGATVQTGELLKSDDLIGTGILNTEGDSIGEIEDIMLNLDTQKVDCIVATFDKVADRLVVLPLQALEITAGGEDVTLKVAEDTVTQAPNFRDDEWSKLADPDFCKQANDFWSQHLKNTETSTGRTNLSSQGGISGKGQVRGLYRASELIGMTLMSSSGRDLAEISDIVIDSRDGTIAYSLVSYGGVLGMGRQLAAVPFSAISFNLERDVATIDATRSVLNATRLRDDHLGVLSDRNFATRVHKTYDVEPYWETFGYVGETEDQERGKSAWMPGSRFLSLFNADRVTSVSGTIESVGTFLPARDDMRGLQLRITDSEGRVTTVLAGPRSFARQEGMTFRVGDKVQIVGSRVNFKGESVIMASEITKNGRTLRLLERSVRPMWDMSELQPVTRSGGYYGYAGEEQRTVTPRERGTWRGLEQEMLEREEGRARDSVMAPVRQLDELLGAPVLDYRGEEVGRLENLIVDTGIGVVAYATVSLKGENRTAVVPWAALEVHPERKLVRVDADRQMLRQATMTRQQLRRIDNLSTARRIHDIFDQPPYWEMHGYISIDDSGFSEDEFNMDY